MTLFVRIEYKDERGAVELPFAREKQARETARKAKELPNVKAAYYFSKVVK